MKVFAFALVFLAAAVGAPRAKGAPPLRFQRAPLGNVIRVLSARFGATITVTADAKAPVTGDFTGLGLAAALAEAGRQAGLDVVALGPKGSGSYRLEPPKAVAGPDPRAAAKAELASAAARRAALLEERRRLLAGAAGTPSAR